MVIRSKLFTMKYNPRNVVPPVASRYLGSEANCLYPKIAHMYKTRDRSVLWWRVSAQHLTAYKRVVRVWLLRRTRVAFQQALKDHGFDAQGKRLAPQAPTSGGSRGAGNLTGSVEITIHPQILRENISDLERNMYEKLGTLLRHQRPGEKKAPVSGGAAAANKWVQLAPQ